MSERRSHADAERDLSRRIEFALGVLGDVVHASTAALSSAYRCLQCGGDLSVVRASSQPRFRHASDAACDGSRVEPEAGVRLLADRLRRELAEDGAVTTWSPCCGPGSTEACPDSALMPRRRLLSVGGTVVSGSACPPPSDVAIMRGREMVIGFHLVSHAAAGASEAEPPRAATPPILRVAIADVLSFRALVPRNDDVAAACCPACSARANEALTEGAAAASEFLDAGFVREAARVHAMWTGVLVAAEESSAASSHAEKSPSTTRRRRMGPW